MSAIEKKAFQVFGNGPFDPMEEDKAPLSHTDDRRRLQDKQFREMEMETKHKSDVAI